jgi:hypothetical protein
MMLNNFASRGRNTVFQTLKIVANGLGGLVLGRAVGSDDLAAARAVSVAPPPACPPGAASEDGFAGAMIKLA